jgi:hypothetical protein
LVEDDWVNSYMNDNVATQWNPATVDGCRDYYTAVCTDSMHCRRVTCEKEFFDSFVVFYAIEFNFNSFIDVDFRHMEGEELMKFHEKFFKGKNFLLPLSVCKVPRTVCYGKTHSAEPRYGHVDTILIQADNIDISKTTSLEVLPTECSTNTRKELRESFSL